MAENILEAMLGMLGSIVEITDDRISSGDLTEAEVVRDACHEVAPLSRTFPPMSPRAEIVGDCPAWQRC